MRGKLHRGRDLGFVETKRLGRVVFYGIYVEIRRQWRNLKYNANEDEKLYDIPLLCDRGNEEKFSSYAYSRNFII